jgi:hypothetical protein
VLPDSPATAKFLSHEQKVIALERLRANNQGYTLRHLITLGILTDRSFHVQGPSRRHGGGAKYVKCCRTQRHTCGLLWYSYAREYKPRTGPEVLEWSH